MDTGDAMRAAEAMGRQAADMIQALEGIEAPSKSNPMFGVAGSALARCRQIAEQVSHLSGEAAGQIRMFESSERRGRELAEARLAAKKRRDDAVGPTISKQAAAPAPVDAWVEEDLWDDEL